MTKIVAVDDDPTVLIYLEQVLKSEGYDIQTTSDGRGALVSMANSVPDLVILDVDMPDLDGLALLNAMREDETLRKVPVIFLTVKDNREDETRGLKAGVVDYISKEVLTPERVDILKFRLRNFFTTQENERLRGVLATIVAANHEINNPMMVVLGSAELLRLKGAVDHNAETKEAVDRIVEASKQIRTVMQRTATLTRFEIKTYLDGIEMLDLGDAGASES
ncbi:MAG: response regulator [Candidatus Latescibacteria bacterium]|jgi:DNA-binding response OmpR family regulator|nr:response regulator [Candidatus Latescibacterota bacterium]MBT5831677.1 response regulator [Candidatus Latescibacterota bacterium]